MSPETRTGVDEHSLDLPTNPRQTLQDTPFTAFSPASLADDISLPGFVIQGEIARGGMGVVYAADDPAFGRAVAVKMLHLGWQASSAAVGRFKTEARITGRLQHPGIPPVHAHGILPDGRPYLVMKLIGGRTLSALLEERADVTRELTRFIQVFEQICQAVGYAHGQGVIHRDLKPSNVMVGAFGEVQVMDWGLAKEMSNAATVARSEPPESGVTSESASEIQDEHPEGTVAGSVLGTLPYMPPEQARGELHRIDSRSDVFALGGILCTILTGQPPYTGPLMKVAECAKAARLDDALGRLDRCTADQELVGLAKRCMAADPADRPSDGGTVANLVAAYRAAVEDRLRTAERDRAAAEARSAELRTKRLWQAIAAGVVAMLAIGGGIIAWWLDRQSTARADAAFRRQVDDDKREAAERERLSRNEMRMERLLDQAEVSLQTDDARAAAAAIDQTRAMLGEGGGDHLRNRLKRITEDLEALREMDQIDTLRWTSRRSRFLTTEAIIRIPDAIGKLGIDLDTTPVPRAGARIKESAARDRLIAALDLWYVRDRSATGRDILRNVDPNTYRDSVRDAIGNGDLDELRALADRPDALTQPAGFAAVLGQIEVISPDRRAQILRASQRRRPSDLTVLMTLGGIYPPGPKTAVERVGWYRAAVTARPTNPSAWNNLGIALRDAGESGEAIEAFRQAALADPAYAPAVGNLGTTLGEAGDTEGAATAFREAVRIAPDWAENWFNLAVARVYLKDVAGAAAAYKTAAALDPSDPKIRFNLGIALDDAGDRAGAIEAYREAIRLDPDYAKAHDNLGLVLKAAGDLAGATKEFLETIRLRPEYAPAQYNLGNTLTELNDLDGAIVAYRNALRIDPSYAVAAFNLGVVLSKKGDAAGSVSAFRDAARLDPSRFGHLLKTLPPLDTAPPPRPFIPSR